MTRGHKNSHNDLTYEFVREVFSYEPETGELRWKKVLSKRIHIGDAAGCLDDQGRIKIGIQKKDYFAHRIIWLWMTGEWPPFEVDHRDQIKSNNRWKNLRLATPSQNHRNRGAPSNNKSGYKGVCWDNNKNKWLVTINKNIDGKKKHFHIGWFDDVYEAGAAYVKAALDIHGREWAHW